MDRRQFVAASLAGATMLGRRLHALAPSGEIEAAIDAAKRGEPISPLVFGGYMEPATTRVWAEMLTDRKFAKSVTNATEPVNPFFRRFMGEPFKPLAPGDAVEMDTKQPFVGKHSPRITLNGAELRGIQQAKLHVKGGKNYVGRIYLAGDPSAKVVVRLVCGTRANDSQVIAMPVLSAGFQKHTLEFKAPADSDDARLEIVGTGTGTFTVGTVSLMPSDNVEGFHAGMIRLYKEAGFKMAKWPGGNFVSAYDWYEGLGDRDKRPPRLQAMWSDRVESNDVGLHEFIAFCRLLDAEPYLTINSGFGDARSAAEEVEYANGSTSTRLGRLRAEHGHPEPFNIRLWCIGNEMYGPWQYGHMSLDQYWTKHNYIVEAMKKVDPRIKVTLSGATISEKSIDAAEKKGNFFPSIWEPPIPDKLPFEFGSLNDWDGWLLEKCADHVDYVSEHTYAYPDLVFDAEKQRFVDAHDALQFRTRRLANRIGEAAEAWQHYRDAIPALKGKNIKFIFDEWGVRFRSADGKSHPSSGMVPSISYALFLHELFRHSGLVEASCPTGGLFSVLVDKSGEAVGFSAEGLVLKLMATHFANATPIATSGTSPQEQMAGTPMVDIPLHPTGSATYPLDVLAAISADGKKFFLSVVNPTEHDQSLFPRTAGMKLESAGRLLQIAAPSVDAQNEPDREPLVKITEHGGQRFGSPIRIPPISVNLYEFEIG